MEVDTNGLIRVLEKIQKRVRAFDERLALSCAIEAVRELDRIQAEQKGGLNDIRRETGHKKSDFYV